MFVDLIQPHSRRKQKGGMSAGIIAVFALISAGTIWQLSERGVQDITVLAKHQNRGLGGDLNLEAIQQTALLFKGTTLVVQSLNTNSSAPVILDGPGGVDATDLSQHPTWRLMGSGSSKYLEFYFCNPTQIGNVESQLFKNTSPSFYDESCTTQTTKVTFEKIESRRLYLTATTSVTKGKTVSHTKLRARINPSVIYVPCGGSAPGGAGDVDGDGALTANDLYALNNLYNPKFMDVDSTNEWAWAFIAFNDGKVEDMDIPKYIQVLTSEDIPNGMFPDADGDCVANNNVGAVIEALQVSGGPIQMPVGNKTNFDFANNCTMRYYWQKTGHNFHGGTACGSHAGKPYTGRCGPFRDINNDGVVDAADLSLLTAFIDSNGSGNKTTNMLYIQTPHNPGMHLGSMMDVNGDCIIDNSDVQNLGAFLGADVSSYPAVSCAGYQNSSNQYDVNNDGKVDGYDLLVLKKAIEKNTQLSSLSGGVPYYDVNGDCKLNNSDYGALVNALESNLTSSLSSNYTDYFEGP